MESCKLLQINCQSLHRNIALQYLSVPFKRTSVLTEHCGTMVQSDIPFVKYIQELN